MKNAILFIFLCFTFIAKGQTSNFFADNEIKKLGIKSVLAKVYENKVKSYNHRFQNNKKYYDTSGLLIKEIIYKSDKDSSENNFLYLEQNQAQIQMISSKIKKYARDSVVASIKNDSTFEIREYEKGALVFYEQNLYNKKNLLIKKINISYSTLSKDISPTLRFYRDAKNDTSVHTKIVYIDSSKAYVKEYFNNSKNNYSEGYIYYNKDNLIERKVIRDFLPHMKNPVNSIELRFYDSKKNLIKIHRLFQEDFELLQKNPKAKVNLIHLDEFKYNDRNMLIERIVFAEVTVIDYPSSNNGSTHKEIRKLVVTFGYEYW